jgi:hypothetical protein
MENPIRFPLVLSWRKNAHHPNIALALQAGSDTSHDPNGANLNVT